MRRRLLAGMISLAVFVLVTLEVPLGFAYARQQRDRISAGVQHDALALVLRSHEAVIAGDRAELRRVADSFEARTGGRAVMVDAEGVLLADSQPRGEGERDFASRPEIAAALEGREVRGSRHSNTLGTELFYVAVPVVADGAVRGAVRVTYPMAFVESQVRRAWLVLAGVGALVLVVVYVAGSRFAAATTRPLRELEGAAERLGAGALSTRAPVPGGPRELRSLAQSFNTTAARLEGLVASQRAFVADASHQLRTPLTALRLRLENLERLEDEAGPRTRGPAGEAFADDVAGAREEVERLSRLVDGLLALARAEERAALPEAIEVGPLVGARCDAWAALAAESGVEVRERVEAGLKILATPGGPEQVLDNLISNALAVAPPGSAVSVTARGVGEGVEVRVADRGPGMTAEQRGRAFDRFWRARAGGSGGSGLGLAIVARLVESDGGAVRIDPLEGGGTEVVVRWPEGRTGDGPSARRPAAPAGSGAR